MTTATRTITIVRPVRDVFIFFADAERDPLWRPEVLSTRRRSGLGVGARYDQEIRGPGGHLVRCVVEVTELVIDAAVTFHVVARGLHRTRRYVFAELDERTAVTLTLDATATGPTAFLRHGEVQRWADEAMESLTWAKALLESGRRDPARPRRH